MTTAKMSPKANDAKGMSAKEAIERVVKLFDAVDVLGIQLTGKPIRNKTDEEALTVLTEGMYDDNCHLKSEVETYKKRIRQLELGYDELKGMTGKWKARAEKKDSLKAALSKPAPPAPNKCDQCPFGSMLKEWEEDDVVEGGEGKIR